MKMRNILRWSKGEGGESLQQKQMREKRQARRRSTKSFKVKANLVPPPIDDDKAQLKLQPKPRLSQASTSIADSESGSDDHDHDNTTSTSTSGTTPPYYRGGGYCRHAHVSYEERWSDAHVDKVVSSWKMTESQRDKLMALKEQIRDVDHPFLNDPHQAVYFLKDEYGKVDMAQKLLRKTAHARQQSPYHIDSILTSHQLPDDYDYFPMCVLQGTDHDGDPIDITRTGVADCWGLYKRHGRDAMIHHALFHQEIVARGAWHDDYEREHHGRKVTQFTVIFDLQGLSSRHLRPGLIPTCGHLARLLQDTYPELVKRVLIINAPSIFKMIWGLVKVRQAS
jgi:CRAL/TRIO domain